MKIRYTLAVIAIAGAWVWGGHYLINTLLTPQRLDVLRRIPWLLSTLHAVLFGLLGYPLYRSSQTALRAAMFRHPRAALIWLTLCGAVLLFGALQDEGGTVMPLTNWLLISGYLLVASSCMLALLVEKWNTTARVRWIALATLTVCTAMMITFGLR